MRILNSSQKVLVINHLRCKKSHRLFFFSSFLFHCGSTVPGLVKKLSGFDNQFRPSHHLTLLQWFVKNMLLAICKPKYKTKFSLCFNKRDWLKWSQHRGEPSSVAGRMGVRTRAQLEGHLWVLVNVIGQACSQILLLSFQLIQWIIIIVKTSLSWLPDTYKYKVMETKTLVARGNFCNWKT